MSKGGGSAEMPDPSQYMPLVQQQADINRLNQVTPFGGTRYNQPEQPAPGTPTYTKPLDMYAWGEGQGIQSDEMSKMGTRSDYNDYKDNFTPEMINATGGPPDPYGAQPEVEQYLSPEIQTIWDKQFSPDAYQSYSDDYMSESKRLLDPVYEQQGDDFRQRMANRGQPVGGEGYNDEYTAMMDAQNRGWESAAFGAKNAGEKAMNTDFNKLMAAMGGSQVSFPQADVMGPANMALNANMANTAANNNASSNMWNTAAGLGSAYLMGPGGFGASRAFGW